MTSPAVGEDHLPRSDLSGAPPFSGSNIVRNPGGSDRTRWQGPAATPLSLNDPIVAAVQYPALRRVCGAGELLAEQRRPRPVANSLRQQTVVGAGDVDASDGKVHARFVYLPVLEDGAHDGEAAVLLLHRRPQRHEGHGGVGALHVRQRGGRALVVFRHLPLHRLAGRRRVGRSGVIDVGDTLELEVVASSCALGGHSGHVYVDAFGSTHPGRIDRRHGALEHGAERGADLRHARRQRRHEHAGQPGRQRHHPDPDNVRLGDQPGLLACGGVVTCNLADLAAGATLDFTSASPSPAATGTITLGNYSIAGTGYPALLGPARTTVVNSPVAVADSYTTTRTPR